MVAADMKRDYSQEAIKALVALHGPRKAARVSGIPFGTISAMCFKFKWKKAAFMEPQTRTDVDAADVIRNELEESKEQSALHLARFTRKAAEEASRHAKPLDVARKVRDVAAVYQSLWPPEEEGGLIEGSILIGQAEVTDNPKEIMAHVREELPGQGPAGD